MEEDERFLTRRQYLGGAAAVLGFGGAYLAQSDSFRDQAAEWGKGIAEILRQIPGFGYNSKAVKLESLVGSQTILPAERNASGYWRGAPALEYDSVNDRLLTHVRHRDPVNRGKRVSIYQLDQETLLATELVSLSKTDLGARSLEGGELISEDGEFRWILSYQDDETDAWGLHERRAPTLDGLRSGGQDINLRSSYYHSKDPVLINGECYVLSSSQNWFQTAVERVNLNVSRPKTTELDITGIGNARITTGGVVGREVFADVWPDFPGINLANILWTSDERSARGLIEDNTLQTDSNTHYVSTSGTSVTYVDAIAIGETVTMLWQAERDDGRNDLVGTQIPLSEYDQLFVEQPIK